MSHDASIRRKPLAEEMRAVRLARRRPARIGTASRIAASLALGAAMGFYVHRLTFIAPLAAATMVLLLTTAACASTFLLSSWTAP